MTLNPFVRAQLSSQKMRHIFSFEPIQECTDWNTQSFRSFSCLSILFAIFNNHFRRNKNVDSAFAILIGSSWLISVLNFDQKWFGFVFVHRFHLDWYAQPKMIPCLNKTSHRKFSEHAIALLIMIEWCSNWRGFWFSAIKEKSIRAIIIWNAFH